MMKILKTIDEVLDEVQGALDIFGWEKGFAFEQCPLVSISDLSVKKARRSKQYPYGAVLMTISLRYKTKNRNIGWSQTCIYKPGKVFVHEDIRLVEDELAEKGSRIFRERFNGRLFEEYNCKKHGWYELDSKAEKSAVEKKAKRTKKKATDKATAKTTDKSNTKKATAKVTDKSTAKTTDKSNTKKATAKAADKPTAKKRKKSTKRKSV